MLRTLAAILMLSVIAPALAQETPAVPLVEAPAASAVDSASGAAFGAANDKLNKALQQDYSGDPDVAFIKAMIARDESAVDLANVILQFGNDDEVAKFAEDVLVKQTAEIAWMRDWLARKGK